MNISSATIKINLEKSAKKLAALTDIIFPRPKISAPSLTPNPDGVRSDK